MNNELRGVFGAAMVIGCTLSVGCTTETATSGGGGAGAGGAPGGGGSGGAAEDDLPRLALRVEARADRITRDGRELVRISVPLDGEALVAAEESNWSVLLAGSVLEGGMLLVFPAVEDASQAGVAVWLFDRVAEEGEPIEVRFRGEVVLAQPLGAPSALGEVQIAPIVVRTPEGEGPVASNEAIAAKMQAFAGLLQQRCNLRLALDSPREVTLSGFGKLEKGDFVSIDDTEAVAVFQEATGELVGAAFSHRLRPLYEELAKVAPVSSRTVRAVVFAQHQTAEEANTITPGYFHSEAGPTLYGIPPYYPGGLPFYWMDPGLDLEEQTPVRLTDEEQDRTYAIYFGEDHLEAFAHELGHLLGLPHPSGSTVIDAEGGSGADNLMESVSECVPECAVRISPQQCEIMLLGMTGFVGSP